MDALNLRELSARESEQVEWKENVADVEDVVATLSAFANDWANLGGGYVVCGAAEGRDEHGFAVVRMPGLDATRYREVEGKVMQLCRDQVTPPLVPLVRELPAEDPSRRILVFVMPATHHAHSFRRKTDGGRYYIRQSRSTVRAQNGLFRELMVRKQDLESWDHRVHPEARVEDLDLVVLRDALQRTPAWDGTRSIADYLRADQRIFALVPSLCAKEPLTAIVRPRNFTLLLFGRDVPRFTSGAYVVFAAYPGVDRSEPHSEVHFVYGPLLEQIRSLGSRLAMHAPMVIDKEDPTTPNAVKYPLRALEEAMVNALVHRDYGAVQPVHITVFSDRVEIESPGGLPSRVDAGEFRDGRAPPVWRNQALAWFCRELNIAQALGQGVMTIYRTMQSAGCPPPEYALGTQSVRCTLRAHPRTTRAALVVDVGQGRTPDLGPGFLAVVDVGGTAIDGIRLLSRPLDVDAWQVAVDEIDTAIERALEAARGELHVFVRAPLAIAAYLGRRLAELAAQRPIVVHQRVPGAFQWQVFSRPAAASRSVIEPYFGPLEEPPMVADARAVLLVVDCTHDVAEPQLEQAAAALGATGYYRLLARARLVPHSLQTASAVTAIGDALAIIAAQHPGVPLHLVISAPEALAVELGRKLAHPAFASATVHHFVPATSSFVPVLDVVRRAVARP